MLFFLSYIQLKLNQTWKEKGNAVDMIKDQMGLDKNGFLDPRSISKSILKFSCLPLYVNSAC